MRNTPTVRTVVDVKKHADPFTRLSPIVNLKQYPRRTTISGHGIAKMGLILASAAVFFLGTASAPINQNSAGAAGQDDQRTQLEQQLADLEQQITEQEGKIEEYRKQGASLSSEIKRLETNITKINLQIRAIDISIRELDGEIRGTKTEISATETRIKESKEALIELIRTIYQQDAESIIEIFIKNPRLSDFFTSVNSLIVVQDNVRASLERIIELRRQLIDQREHLAAERIDAATLKEYQDAQRRQVRSIQTEKKDLLTVTQGNEAKYKQLLVNTKKTAAEVRNQIFKLLGGGELTFGEAYKIAKFAEDATGIRAALTLAVLTQESATDGLIGRNLGRCFYNDPRNNVSGTVMKDSQKPDFLAILGELGLDPAKTPVSCPIPRDGAYGGAMGPAQYMPVTWQLFKDRVASITGSRPPSPFSNGDSFVGTALYLQDAYNSSSCRQYAETYSTVAPRQLLRERCTAARYYAGGNWWNYRLTYGDAVAQRAEQFQQDIDVLNES